MRTTKWTGLLLAVCLCFGGFGAAAATPPDKAVFDLVSLGILQGDETGDVQLDQPVTRAEFAAAVVRLMALEDAAAAGGTSVFTDVPADEWYAPYVALVCGMGLMNGVSQSEFAPSDPVTLEQAVKTVVIALGYGMQANAAGGYPAGHMMTAANAGLLRGVDTAAAFDRGALAALLYNALDTDMVVQSAVGGDASYEVRKGETLRSRHVTETADDALYQVTGVVTATYDTWLESPLRDIKQNQVEIGRVLYDVGQTNAAAYLGQEVDLYARGAADGTNTLISVRPSRRSSSVRVTDAQIRKIDSRYISYDGAAGGEEKCYLAADMKLVKNGALELVQQPGSIALRCGELTMVDNDGDQEADYVFWNEYQSARVDEVQGSRVRFAAGQKIAGHTFFDTMPEDRLVHVRMTLADGTSCKAEDVKADDIVSAVISEDHTYYRIWVSRQSVKGTVTELGDEEIAVDGTWYPTQPEKEFALQPGDAVRLFLDHTGRVADVKQQESAQMYGYIVQAGKNSGGFGGMEVKMLTGSAIAEDIEKNEQDLDDKNEIPVLVCENKKVEILPVADRLNLDGQILSATPAAVQPGLYRYTLGSGGKITRLEKAQQAGGTEGVKIKYNVYDKTFGGSASMQGFAIDKDTKVICLPEGGAQTDDDYMVQVRIDNKNSENRFNAQGYELDETTKKVKLLVVTEIMNATQVAGINVSTAKIGMVKKVRKSSNEDQETIFHVTMIHKDEEITMESVPLRQRNAAMAELRPGDLIYFVKTGAGKLENVKIIYSFEDGVTTFYKDKGTDSEQICGYIRELSFHDVDSAANKLVTTTTLALKTGDEKINVQERNAPPVFLYDQASKTVSAATLKDAVPYGGESVQADLLYIIMPHTSVNACVIVR